MTDDHGRYDDGTPVPLGSEKDWKRVTPTDPGIDAATGIRKITGEELRAKMAARRDHDRARRAEKVAKQGPALSLARMGATAVFAVGFIGLLVYQSATSGAVEEELAQMNQEMSDLRTQISSAESRVDNLPEPAVMTTSMVGAIERAQEVADLQNRIAEVNTIEGGEPELALYADLVDEGRKFYTDKALTGGDFLPHGRWYLPQEIVPINDDGDQAWRPMGADKWEWFVIQGSNINANGTVPVMWEARITGGEDDGQLLAWVTGTYNPTVRSFSQLTFGHTPAGWDRLGATTPTEPNGRDITDSQLIREAQKARDKAQSAAEEGQE